MNSGERYRLTRSAQRSLLEIFDFLCERESVDRALHVHGQFVEAFERIADMPGAGRRREHVFGERVRVRSVFGWLVVYEQIGTTVTVFRIVHGARDLDEFLGSWE